MAKGYTQIYGIYYQETFCLVAKITIKILLPSVVIFCWSLQQFNVKIKNNNNNNDNNNNNNKCNNNNNNSNSNTSNSNSNNNNNNNNNKTIMHAS